MHQDVWGGRGWSCRSSMFLPHSRPKAGGAEANWASVQERPPWLACMSYEQSWLKSFKYVQPWAPTCWEIPGNLGDRHLLGGRAVHALTQQHSVLKAWKSGPPSMASLFRASIPGVFQIRRCEVAEDGYVDHQCSFHTQGPKANWASVQERPPWLACMSYEQSWLKSFEYVEQMSFLAPTFWEIPGNLGDRHLLGGREVHALTQQYSVLEAWKSGPPGMANLSRASIPGVFQKAAAQFGVAESDYLIMTSRAFTHSKALRWGSVLQGWFGGVPEGYDLSGGCL